MNFVRKRRVNLPLGVLGAVLLGSLLYIYVFIFVVHIQASRNYLSHIIGFLGVVFFATIPIFIIYKYLLRALPEQKILSVDESGIELHAGDGCRYSWQDIKSINKVMLGKTKRLTLSIRSKNSRAKAIAAKRKGNVLYLPEESEGDGDISIVFEGLSPNLDDAIREIQKYYPGPIKEVFQ